MNLFKEIVSHLSVLYNNRASCHQHVCDFKSCIRDCDQGLRALAGDGGAQQELALKLRMKRAHAFESLEKYTDALAEYERVMQIDSRFRNVQESYGRVRRLLISTGKLGMLLSLFFLLLLTLLSQINRLGINNFF